MKNSISIIILLSYFYLLSSCDTGSPISSSEYMIIDEVTFVDDFPMKFSLTNIKEVEIDLIGINSFCIYDSLLIVAKNRGEEGLWSILTLPDFKHLGDFLTRGEGPYEFFQSPNVVTSASFFKENGDLCAAIVNSSKRELYNFNISQSITNKELRINLKKKSLPPVLFDFFRIDSLRYFCRELNMNVTQQIRSILEADGSMSTLPYFDKLNQAIIRENEDINILSTIIKYNSDKDLIVEMPISLNYLNIYSLNGTFSKTICTEERLLKISKIQNTGRWKRLYTYTDLRLFSDFWGVVFINEEEKKYQMGKGKIPIIQLFDWEGNPLIELNPNRHFTSFDIDLKNGFIYLFDQQTDEFTVCDKDILKEMYGLL